MTNFFNKLPKMFLSSLMVFSVATSTFGATPINDHASHWAKETIHEALSSGIANGYPDGSFKPNNAITRAEFFALTNNVFGFTDSIATTYTDVPRDAWYTPVITRAEAAGYISGYPDGGIHPKGNINRAEVAAIISRLRSLSATSNAPSFIDASSMASWSRPAIIAVSEAQIMNGYPDGSFKPTSAMTRAEALVALTNTFNFNTANPPNHDVVKIPISSINFTAATMNLTAGGSTGTLIPNISPSTATNKNIIWSSDNTAVATVVNGVVTPLAAGTALISATSAVDGTKVATTVVTVLVANQPVVVPATDPVNLGLAGNYAILAKTAITSVPDSAITGDIGVSPSAAASVTGFSLIADSSTLFSTSDQVTGKVYAANYASPTPVNLTTAISNLETAYTDAAGRTVDFTELHSGDLSGKTLTPGVYKWGTSVLINSNVTLSGGPNDVWIFQVAGGITQANGTKILLSGGAKAENIFWQSAQTVSIGTNAHFEGIVISMTNITMATNSSINGRLLAQTAVTLDKSTVVAP